MSDNMQLVPVEPAASGAIVSAFGVGDGGSTLTRATTIANELAVFVKQRAAKGRPIVVQISNKQYPLVECWTTMGAMMGVFPVTEWVHSEGNWAEGTYVATARVVARTLGGAVVGTGEGLCSQAEKLRGSQRWQDQYAVFSMAQTRAISKSLRMPLGWVVQLAGFEPTPADEVPPDGFKDPTNNAAPEPTASKGDIYNHDAMQDIMASPMQDENGNVIVSDDMKRQFVWSAGVHQSEGDMKKAESAVQSWGTFTAKDGKVVSGPLPGAKKGDGSFVMSGKWLNMIFGRAKEAYSQFDMGKE